MVAVTSNTGVGTCYQTSRGFLTRSLALIALIICTPMANAATKIYVQNDTNSILSISDIRVTGAALSAKAWKKGAESVGPGERLTVLEINRTGKFNWMDPTPRFVEPGKTVFFGIEVKINNDVSGSPLILGQKLFGTGGGSKMWYRVDGVTESHEWSLESRQITAQWAPNDKHCFIINYQLFSDKKDKHVEYIVSGK